MKAIKVQKLLRKNADPKKAQFLLRFFKTGKGQYAEGDKFLGLVVPVVRQIVKQYKDLPLGEVQKLLHSKWHEERLCALLIMVEQFKKGDKQERKEIFDLYIKNTDYINNWDLVDLSAGYIVGQYLAGGSKKVLYKLAKSDKLFERRIAVIATFHFIQSGDPKETFKIVDMVMKDKHDLMHKAAGWMLREVGKRVSRPALEEYLLPRYKTMPRTMLRYSIGHFSLEERRKYLLGLI